MNKICKLYPNWLIFSSYLSYTTLSLISFAAYLILSGVSQDSISDPLFTICFLPGKYHLEQGFSIITHKSMSFRCVCLELSSDF